MKRKLIAHQLNEIAVAPIRAGLPPNYDLFALDPASPWELPLNAEIIIAYTPAIIDQAWMCRPEVWPGNIRWLYLRSSGIDEYPKWIFEAPLITCGRGASATAIAEFVFAAMLAHEKKMPRIWIDRADQWQRTDLGTLDGKVLGLLGFGQIGIELAKRALAFNMKVVAHRRENQRTDFVFVKLASLDEVLAVSDHLVVALPLTDATRGMLNADKFRQLKSGVHFINVARGAIVDESAFRDALTSDKVAAASLDVWDPEPAAPDHWIYKHPKVRLSPHIAASSPGTSERYGRIFLDSFEKFRRGKFDEMYGIVNSADGY